MWVCHIWPLLCWDKLLLCPIFWQLNGFEFCQKHLLHLLKLLYFLSFNLLVWFYHIDLFAYIDDSLHPWCNLHLIMTYLQTINAGEDVKKWSFLYCWWECRLIQLLYRTVWRFLKKLWIKLPYDSAFPLLGIYPEKNYNSKRPIYANIHCSIIYNSQDIEAT